jgi:hypothetical protein
MFKWFKCSSYLKKGQSKSNHFWLPYIDDGTGAVVDSSVHTHVICTRGLQFLLDIGMKRYQSIQIVSTFTAVLPTHKTVGKPPPHALEIIERKYEPLKRYFEYMSNLGEVRVTKLLQHWSMRCWAMQIATKNGQETTYLPISIGYHA